MESTNKMQQHTPILVKEILESIPVDGEIYVDGTCGHGGHIEKFLQSPLGDSYKKVLAIDRDQEMLAYAKQRLHGGVHEEKISFFCDSYTAIPQYLGSEQASYILLDLGINMGHVKGAERGFSIFEKGELDMRFSATSTKTASDLLLSYSVDQLSRIFVTYGDFSEKSALYISKAIIDARVGKSIRYVQDLVSLLYSIGIRKHQLPIIFQCIRIETNNELDHVQTFLETFLGLLKIGGRCGIMSFHSIEDRLIKYGFKKREELGYAKLVNKKVIVPHYTEMQKNRASRTAKLRILEKIK